MLFLCCYGAAVGDGSILDPGSRHSSQSDEVYRDWYDKWDFAELGIQFYEVHGPGVHCAFWEEV